MSAARLLDVLAAEVAKAVRAKSTLVLALVFVGYLAAILALFASGPPLTGDAETDALLGDPARLLLVAGAGIGSIVLAIFAAQLVGHELSRGTLRALLLARARRRDVAAAKLLLVALAAVLLAAAAWLAAWTGGALLG
ncbi:MAG TPA: ABC transporter permease subunit, partial [Candidatus Thermoplasmatota archaeon]|nr:ABC transporter permease subunit [Candidatus Thermoplasmatota archaeon]